MRKEIMMFLAVLMIIMLGGCANIASPSASSSQAGDVQRPETGSESAAEDSEAEEQPTEDPRFTEVERDENGNIIRTLEGERGKASVERFYDSGGTLLQEIEEKEDGQRDERHFYPNGRVCTEEISLPDGKVVRHQFAEDGRQKSEEILFADGRRELTIFDENGRRVRMQIKDDQGNDVELEFNAQDVIIREIIHFTDGTEGVHEYYEDGKRKFEQYRNTDGSATEREFDRDGNLIRDVFISPDGTVQDNLASNQPTNPEGTTEGNGSGQVQGTLVGSVTQEGEYTVVVLGQDNWSDYLEEYMDVLIIPDQDRVILRKYFIVKKDVGEVDANRSHVELQYIYENRTVSCTVDMANKVFTPGSIISVGEQELSYIELDQFRVLNWQYVDGELLGYGLSCSACEVNGQSTQYGDSAIVGIHWITGTLYLK